MEYYNKDYFDWQKNLGAFGGIAELFKFENHIRSTDNVIDFGSGGGFLLHNIDAKQKIGIEINETARDQSNELGVVTVESADHIDDEWADVIISNHALEHVENPLMELKRLYKKLKSNGTIVFVVPNEKKNKFVEDDINLHLYTWSALNLGNLFKVSGFKVESVEEIKHRWPKKYMQIRTRYGEKIFNIICRINGALYNDISQIKIVAKKP